MRCSAMCIFGSREGLAVEWPKYQKSVKLKKEQIGALITF